MDHYKLGSAVLGAFGDEVEILGGFDLAVATRQINAITPITVSVARIMLEHGKMAIAEALETGKATLTTPELPGTTSRNNVAGKLDWHKATLMQQGDPNAVYASAADLKKWVLQAFIEENAAEEGRAYTEQLASKRWAELMNNVASAVAALPRAIASIPKAILKLPGDAFEASTGVPAWVLPVGGILALGILGYGIYKIALATAPAVGRVAAARYLP